MKRLITTIASGDAINFGHITIPRMAEYARRVNADLWVITQPVFGEIQNSSNSRNPSWWKVGLLEWLSRQELYHALLHLDIDVLIKKDAPDVFGSLSPLQSLIMARDMNSDREFPLWQAWAKEKYGLDLNPAEPSYFNAGVILARPAAGYHLRVFRDHYPVLHDGWLEQHTLNCIFHGLPEHHQGVLPETFNVPFPYLTTDHTAGHFLHLCGLANQDKLPWLEKLNELDV